MSTNLHGLKLNRRKLTIVLQKCDQDTAILVTAILFWISVSQRNENCEISFWKSAKADNQDDFGRLDYHVGCSGCAHQLYTNNNKLTINPEVLSSRHLNLTINDRCSNWWLAVINENDRNKYSLLCEYETWSRHACRLLKVMQEMRISLTRCPLAAFATTTTNYCSRSPLPLQKGYCSNDNIQLLHNANIGVTFPV